jgi:uncharacterized repeat protein (TIGR04138 family)
VPHSPDPNPTPDPSQPGDSSSGEPGDVGFGGAGFGGAGVGGAGVGGTGVGGTGVGGTGSGGTGSGGTGSKPGADREVHWPTILEQAGSYPIEAFNFVREGLNHTVERALLQHEAGLRAGGLGNPDTHHVTGQQLCLGLRDYAILQYGMLAPAVLRHWHIVRTEDFGRIVYAMIEGGVMSKTNHDSIDDFSSVYDFDEAFSDAHLSQRIGG